MKKLIVSLVFLTLSAIVLQAQVQEIVITINLEDGFVTEVGATLTNASDQAASPNTLSITNTTPVDPTSASLEEGPLSKRSIPIGPNGAYVSNEEYTSQTANDIPIQKTRTILVWPYGDDMFQNQKFSNGEWIDVGVPF